MSVCKECNNLGVQKSTDNYALTTWSRQDGEIVVNPGDFMPLQGYVCSSCGSVTFKIDRKALS